MPSAVFRPIEGIQWLYRADRLESPQALQLRLFQTMGEIAVNQNSTIILPVPIDLLRPYLSSSPDGSRGDYEARAARGRRGRGQAAL
jgi:hypothetical protein